jgi:hypothetical protein
LGHKLMKIRISIPVQRSFIWSGTGCIFLPPQETT